MSTKPATPAKAAPLVKRSEQTVIYMRLPIVVLDRVRSIAKARGWPHSIASVGAEALERGLEPIPSKDSKASAAKPKKAKTQ